MSGTKSNKEDLSIPLVNKVVQSGLLTLDLEDYYPKQEIEELDISQFLFKGILLKEDAFKNALAAFNWEQYSNKIAAVHCSTDALIQPWAYMFVAKQLAAVNAHIQFGKRAQVLVDIYANIIANLDLVSYQDQKVMLKGCSSKEVPQEVFGIISARLLPIVQSLMYGEACSNVPVYKKKKL